MSERYQCLTRGLMGRRQSGATSQVRFEMYIRFLSREVKYVAGDMSLELRNEKLDKSPANVWGMF